jgi:hypothetical protein
MDIARICAQYMVETQRYEKYENDDDGSVWCPDSNAEFDGAEFLAWLLSRGLVIRPVDTSTDDD